MVHRRMPKPSEILPLLRPAPIRWDATERRLARAANIADLRAIARRRTPRAVFDYTDGAADGELSLSRSRSAYARVEFVPTVLRDVSEIDTSRTILGQRSTLPFAFAPTGFTRMMHTEGESAVASVAQEVGIPFSLSTMGTTTIEQVVDVAPSVRRWFQLYLWRDRAYAKDLVQRAADAGYDTLMLTVDTPVGGARLRDVRNGLTIPPALSLRTFLDGARHPHWWFDMFTTDPLAFSNLQGTDGTIAQMINRVFDPALTMADVEWLRGTWPGTLVIKGIQSVTDARRVVDAGADAVLLSNHGGRQLDRAPVPLELIEPTVAELKGEADVLVDTGITHGADIVAAIALGANAALVGRAYLYGLMAGGRRGVEKTVAILRGEIERTLALMGVTRIDDLRPEHVRLRSNG
ncbi:MAG: alpha-hydroxy-acid oxidizing protein [Pseudonocardia sp.]|uniref:alpha-hydroxy acid oxidase n=1 Tax=unclassified Pseudonocardia TaxID=2619320 RepID=UPI00086D7321|nr:MULTISPECIES: alpha-hydroxy acid oxidase [unclassified Pseudonocardia]MBN9108482.1 alpha-hydroxy-acid oxidizing protein [Pseudonocardia sp.]ODV07860.1 MAG: alpha-hydroxy-acid oxidizing enzyme [Pseudonocardia sp. SCN 73-27]